MLGYCSPEEITEAIEREKFAIERKKVKTALRTDDGKVWTQYLKKYPQATLDIDLINFALRRPESSCIAAFEAERQYLSLFEGLDYEIPKFLRGLIGHRGLECPMSGYDPYDNDPALKDDVHILRILQQFPPKYLFVDHLQSNSLLYGAVEQKLTKTALFLLEQHRQLYSKEDHHRWLSRRWEFKQKYPISILTLAAIRENVSFFKCVLEQDACVVILPDKRTKHVHWITLAVQKMLKMCNLSKEWGNEHIQYEHDTDLDI
jgi:hypothetical protein